MQVIGKKLEVKPQGIIDAKFLLIIPKSSINKMATPIRIGVYDGNKLIKEITTSFLGPVNKKEIEEDEKED